MTTPLLSTTDIRVDTGQGYMAVRYWQPGHESDIASTRAPIILLHDSLGCIALWRNFPQVLAQHTGRRVIAYDRLGFGQADARTYPPNPDFIQEEAEHSFPILLQQLEVKQFIVLGHSVGGGMAVHCAARFPDRCLALITESAQAFVEDKTRAGIEEARALFSQADAFDKLARYHGNKTSWVLDAWVNTWLSPAFATWSLDSVLPQVHCPTLVIHGEEDEYGSTLHPQTISNHVSGHVEMDILPGVRHVPHREQEANIAQRVARFIDSHV